MYTSDTSYAVEVGRRDRSAAADSRFDGRSAVNAARRDISAVADSRFDGRSAVDSGSRGISATNNSKRKSSAWKKYLAASVIVLICSLVYEHFSHGVYSGFMLGAFLVPLLAGALPCLISDLTSRNKKTGWSGKLASDLQLASVATLTAGCLVKGALDIYGTDNGLLIAYPLAGIALAIAALVAMIVSASGGSSSR